MTTTFLISHFEPLPVGHGGNHRCYQIWWDLVHAFGRESVRTLDLPSWRRLHAVGTGSNGASLPAGTSTAAPHPPARILRQAVRATLPQAARHLPRRWRQFWSDDAFAAIAADAAASVMHRVPEFLAYCRSEMAGAGPGTVCVIEHIGFTDLCAANRVRGVPTAICLQNVESLDLVAPLRFQREAVFRTMANLAEELLRLADCDARLAISRVEAGLVGGLGQVCQYYPYVPVGDIREGLDAIRRRREHTRPAKPTFVMIGTVKHGSTRASFEWFLRQAAEHGWPDAWRLVIVGLGAESLVGKGAAPGIEARGWLAQTELDELLTGATAVLAPHVAGFGALTRLPELGCAGIPVLTSTHVGHALDLPPGCHTVDDDWPAWRLRLEEWALAPPHIDLAAFEEWRMRQSQPLVGVVQSLAGNQAGATA